MAEAEAVEPRPLTKEEWDEIEDAFEHYRPHDAQWFYDKRAATEDALATAQQKLDKQAAELAALKEDNRALKIQMGTNHGIYREERDAANERADAAERALTELRAEPCESCDATVGHCSDNNHDKGTPPCTWYCANCWDKALTAANERADSAEARAAMTAPRTPRKPQ